MAFYDKLFSNRINEAIKSFDNKGDRLLTDKQIADQSGEGVDDLFLMNQGYGRVGTQSFSNFYNSYLNKTYDSEVAKINNYRVMAQNAEIGDVIEDATNESISEYDDGDYIRLVIKDEKLEKNENIVKNIYFEFKELFDNRIDLGEKLWDMFRNYLIDGRLYYERVVKKSDPKYGIVTIKKLPSETMDFIYNPRTSRIEVFFQYLSKNIKRPTSIDEANKREDVVVFNPEQIGYVDYGIYGITKQQVYGFLEKAKVPYNQLKLLETSVIIYRIVRAPERLVFKIDTGNMPKDKALKFVEKIKMRFVKKQSYNPTTGALSQEPEVMCIRHNTEIPLLDGRNLKLDDIIKEHNEGKENYVYTINQDTLEIEPGKILKAAITRLNEKIIRVHLDDGSYFDTTYDHKYILRDGSVCRADNLKEGTSLMPLYRKNEKIKSYLDDRYLYEMVYIPGKNKWEFTHKVIAEKHTNKIKKTNECVHHKDFNHYNNTPNNLEIIDFKTHGKRHSEKLKSLWKNNYNDMHNAVIRGRKTLLNNDEKLNNMKEKLKINWKNNYENRCNSISNGIVKYLSNDENRKKHSLHIIKTNIEQNKVEKMRNVLNTLNIREKQKEAVSKHKKEWFSIPENKEKFIKNKSMIINDTLIKMFCNIFIKSERVSRDKLLNIINNDNIFMSYFEDINKNQNISNRQFKHLNKNVLWKIIKKMGYDNYPDFRQNFAEYKNHKIIKIEYLNELDNCGCIEVEGNHNFAISQNGISKIFIKNSILENFYLPTSSDGRGSDITSIGGDAKGFTELDDIYYFAKKLYRALKYPLSRVVASQEKGESLFGQASANEISRDEIKWSKWLERQQNKFCKELRDLFLLHLEFRGFKKQYNLTKDSFKITMPPPSHYKDTMAQAFREQQFANYNQLAQSPEFSKYFLIKKYLEWTDEDLKENKKGFKMDEKYFPPAETMDDGLDTGAEEDIPPEEEVIDTSELV